MFMLAGVVAVIAQAAPLSPQEVFARASPGVGYVVAGDSFGSVVAVTKNRVVTNWHVVKEATSKPGPGLLVRVGALESRAVLVGVSVDRDVAVLQLLSGELTVVPPRRVELPAVGEKVFTIGSPNGLSNTFADGLVSNLQSLKDLTLIQTTAAISKGSSGGGLFDDKGRLVGLTTLFIRDGQQLNFAVPVTAVEDALGSLFAQPEVLSSINALPLPLRVALTNSLTKLERSSLSFATEEDWEALPDVPSQVEVDAATDLEALTKTDRANWSKDGWADFRWGMGAADVEEVLRRKDGRYRATNFVCAPGERPKEMVCDCFENQHAFRWEGTNPILSFWFFDRALLALEIGSKVPAGKADAKFREIELSIRKALGPPKEQRAAKDGEPATTRWMVRTLRAELSLLPPTKRVTEWQVILNYSDDELEQRSRGLSPQQLVSPAEAAKKTPPKGWSNFGWNDFRWGMGPGDVEAVLSKKDGEFRASSFECEFSDVREATFGCHTYEDQHSFKVLGAVPSLDFVFFKGELWEINFMFFPDVPSGRSMFTALEQKLVEKYRKATSREVPDLASRDMVSASIEWASPALVVKLELNQPPAQYWSKGSSIWLSYFDPERHEAFKRAPIPKAGK